MGRERNVKQSINDLIEMGLWESREENLILTGKVRKGLLEEATLKLSLKGWVGILQVKKERKSEQLVQRHRAVKSHDGECWEGPHG